MNQNLHDAILIARKTLSQFARTHATADAKGARYHISQTVVQTRLLVWRRWSSATNLLCRHSMSLFLTPESASALPTWHSNHAVVSGFQVPPFWMLFVSPKRMIAAEKLPGDCSVGEERSLSFPVVASLVETYKPCFLNGHACYIANGSHRSMALGDFGLGSRSKMRGARSKKRIPQAALSIIVIYGQINIHT